MRKLLISTFALVLSLGVAASALANATDHTGFDRHVAQAAAAIGLPIAHP